ncbi:MAG: glycosyltransferase family 39 protein [Chloroflexota bacterium]|nr:glycosyltransferase family 39 protein [Chloroflexota bacterium]
MRQINLYPPTPDEFYSMYNVGWLVGGPFTPLDVIEQLYTTSPNHVPGYFILLNVWGHLTLQDIASARLFGVFCGLLSLCVYYRLARDFAGPVGLFAIIIIASNSYFNYYISHARMYTLFTLMAGLTLWFYFRIVFQLRHARRRDYVALGAAIFLFLNVHAFSGVFLLVLAVYHLAFLARDRKWQRLALTAVMAALLAAPSYLIIVLRGIPLSKRSWTSEASSAWDVIAAWLELSSNGQPLLVAISAVGLLLAARQRRPRTDAVMALVFIHLVALGLLSDVTQYIITTNLRYLLPSFLIFALLMGIGIHALYRYRRFLALLLLLWPIAGLHYQRGADWDHFLAGRIYSFINPPWQVIAPKASAMEPNPLIISYGVSNFLLDFANRIDYSQRHHYFDTRDLSAYFSADPHDFNLTVRNNALVAPRIWVLYRSSITTSEHVEEIRSAINNYDYELCDTIQAGVDTVILDYAWPVLDCAEPEALLDARTALHEIQFFGAEVKANGSTLTFVDRWSPTVEFSHEDYSASYQLISADWDNVAQVDLPLVHEGRLRQFGIDIGNVAPGNYRLMAVVYDKRTGQRLAWNNVGAPPPELLPLAEIVLE